MLQKIGWVVRNRVMGKGEFKENDENVAIGSKWGISQNTFY